MTRNSCHNHPPRDGRTTHQAPDGWTADGRRILRTVVTQWQPLQCTHLLPASDPGCTGCRWRNEP